MLDSPGNSGNKVVQKADRSCKKYVSLILKNDVKRPEVDCENHPTGVEKEESDAIDRLVLP